MILKKIGCCVVFIGVFLEVNEKNERGVRGVGVLDEGERQEGDRGMGR